MMVLADRNCLLPILMYMHTIYSFVFVLGFGWDQKKKYYFSQGFINMVLTTQCTQYWKPEQWEDNRLFDFFLKLNVIEII